MNIQSYFRKQIRKIDRALDAYLPRASEYPSLLHEAMRYAVFSGGKRLRPMLVLAACRTVGGDERRVMPAACALELIHNYSLIHDDLPCMDNDDTRRGRPACHKKFGESLALLAGDALLTVAFWLLNKTNGALPPSAAKRQLKAAYLVAEAIGHRGMIGGQAADIRFQGKEMDLPTLEYIDTHKTGSLIAVSVQAGAVLGGGRERDTERLTRYGKYIGLAFQIVDDIMDREGYAKILGVPEARKEAERLKQKAKNELRPFGAQASVLNEIADFLLTRKY